MELRQLRYFVAVAETRNFTRASELLHIAQPPLSRQIQLLEAELGAPLLLRSSRPVRLTDAGRLFYEQALQVLARIDSMKAAVQHLGHQQRQRLVIGFVPSALYGGLTELIRQLRQRHADSDIQLVELTTSLQQVSALLAGRIDIGFGRIRSGDDSVTRIVLGEERLVLAAPAGLRLDAKGALPLDVITGQRLIVYPKEPRPSFADHVLSLLRDDAIQPREIIEVRELQTALGLVAAEAGICLIPSSARIRHDVVYHEVVGDRATSPIILMHRIGDRSWYIDPVRQLGREIYGALMPLRDAR
jgi:DNA-binding transcriptional LysR family regulator